MRAFAFAIRLLVVALAGGVPLAIAQSPAPGSPVSPGQLFASELLDVRAPDSAGWLLAGGGRNGISFARRGAGENETFAAQAFVFEMPATTTGDELVRFVRDRVGAINPAPRFHETDSAYRYHEERGYPCVDTRIEYDDTSITTSIGPLALQVVALYCRHPARKTTGFSVAYSRRGEGRTDAWRDAAKRYIDGVVVPAP